MIGDHIQSVDPVPLDASTRGVWGALVNTILEEFRAKFNETTDAVAQVMTAPTIGASRIGSAKIGSAVISPPPVSVEAVNGRHGAVLLTAADVGLSSVNNTADVNKPISMALQAALNAVVDIPKVGVASTLTFLRGDGVWAVPTSGGVTYVDNGDGSVTIG